MGKDERGIRVAIKALEAAHRALRAARKAGDPEAARLALDEATQAVEEAQRVVGPRT